MSGLILLLWGFVRGGGIMAKRADAFGVRGRNRRHAGGAPEVAQYEEYRDWVNTPRPPMEPFEGQRRGMEERFARQDARNPEERSADRPLIEGLQSGALVEDSPVPGRPRVRPAQEPAGQRFADWLYWYLQRFEEERGRQDRVGYEASQRYPPYLRREPGSGVRGSPGGRFGFTALTGPYTHTGPRLRG